MKKKLVLAVCGVMMVSSLCACGSKSKDTKQELGQAVSEGDMLDEEITSEEEKKSEEETTEAAPETEKKEETTEAPALQTTEAVIDNAPTAQVVETDGGAVLVEEINEEVAIDPSWPDTVYLVNDKGEKTTGYLLADGTYMDRICMVYTYDGKDTWTDTNGVEWSKVVE